MGNIRVKAGKKAYQIIKDGGFDFDLVTTYFGPAAGPRWLVAAGFDLSLLNSGLLGRVKPVTLIGSSAGAWRFAAWVQPEADMSYRRFMESYIAIGYDRTDTPRTIQAAMIALVDRYVEDDALSFALSDKRYRLAIITCRVKNLAAADSLLMRKLGIGLAFLANALSREWLYFFAERVVFYNGPKPPPFCLACDFRGLHVPLTEINFKSALLASGAIPLVVEGIVDIYGAPRGRYVDGGLLDYHLTHDYSPAGGLTLFFHHQERIIPGWLDQKLKNRSVAANILDNVLMVFPKEELVARLPDGKIPDRNDFLTYLGKQEERKANWLKAVDLTADLGEEFLELVASNRLRQLVEPL